MAVEAGALERRKVSALALLLFCGGSTIMGASEGKGVSMYEHRRFVASDDEEHAAPWVGEVYRPWRIRARIGHIRRFAARVRRRRRERADRELRRRELGAP